MCKILKVRKVQTSPYHACSNTVERFHKSLHDGLSETSDDVKDADQVQRLENLKLSLTKAYQAMKQNIRKSHQVNKFWYDKKAEEMEFQVGDLVCLFCPARKPRLCQKFRKWWTGPYKITAKVSDLNYRLMDLKGKERVVHVNRLKNRIIRQRGNHKIQGLPVLRNGEGQVCRPKKKMK